MAIQARRIRPGDAGQLDRIFAGTPWARGPAFYERLASEHGDDDRCVLVGLSGGRPVGYCALLRQSPYPPFREGGVPEIQDLNVAPDFRRMGVASRILDHAERLAFRWGDSVGIGVGLHPGYRAAQRLYVLRSYVPDGNGVFYRGRFPQEGEQVVLDDDLVLYLMKKRLERPAV